MNISERSATSGSPARLAADRARPPGSSRAPGTAFGHLGPARPRGRPAGAGHPRLHRQRPHHAWSSARRWPTPAGGSTRGSCGWNMGARADTIERLASASTPQPRQAGPDRRLEPRRSLRPGASPRPSRPGQRGRHARHARSAAIPSSEQCLAPLRMGRGPPGRRTRRSRASPTSRRSRRSPSGRARDGIIAPRAAHGLAEESDKTVEFNCNHMAFGVSPKHRASRWCRKSTLS